MMKGKLQDDNKFAKSQLLMYPKQKRRIRRTTKVTCSTDIGKNGVTKKMDMGTSQSPLMLSPVDLCKQNFILRTPKSLSAEACDTHSVLESPPMPSIDSSIWNNLLRTPKTPLDKNIETESRLESLPTDLLVKIMCHLHHDQLRPVFQVSTTIMKAVLRARKFHFDYTTPDHGRQATLRAMARRSLANNLNGKCLSVESPTTPKAPRPPCRTFSYLRRLGKMDQLPADLFQDPTVISPACILPSSSSSSSRPLWKSLTSHRALFDEGVAQNKRH